LGAEGAEAGDAGVVRDAAGEREAGRAGGPGIAGIVRESAEADAEVDVEAVAGAIADQDRLAAHGPGPRADGGAVVRAAFVGAEIHEHLEAVREAVTEPEVDIAGADARRTDVGEVHRAAAEADREQ